MKHVKYMMVGLVSVIVVLLALFGAGTALSYLPVTAAQIFMGGISLIAVTVMLYNVYELGKCLCEKEK